MYIELWILQNQLPVDKKTEVGLDLIKKEEANTEIIGTFVFYTLC